MPFDQPAGLLQPSLGSALRDRSRSAPRATGLAWHIITCEYPPLTGGVSDYTFQVAGGLAAQGDEVHVWHPEHPVPAPSLEGVTVHGDLGQVTPSDLARVG